MKNFLGALTVCLAGVGATLAAEASATLSRVPLEIANAGDGAMTCKVSLAHWFSAEVGRAEPGGNVVGDLWSDPATGAVYFLNASGDRMPVERFWCGPSGHSWANRFDITLERKAGQPVEPIRIKCSGKDLAFSCGSGAKS